MAAALRSGASLGTSRDALGVKKLQNLVQVPTPAYICGTTVIVWAGF